MKNIFTKYPKLIIFVLVILVSYLIFRNQDINSLISNLNSLSYLGTFVAGMLYSFGFTAPLATGFFITLHSKDILFIGILGGIGSMFADLFIFKFTRFSFSDEFQMLRKSRIGIKLKKIGRRIFGKRTRKILLYIFACLLIASPMPDESGMIILAGLTKIQAKIVAILSFVLNTLGIVILLWIGNLL